MKFLSAVLLFTLSFSSYANNGNDGFVTISNFQLWSNTYNAPQIRVIISGDTYYNPSNCSNVDSYMVTTALGDKVQDRIYAALLSATLTKKSVVLRIENNGCESGRPSIMNVVIQ
jgi:hypothetical protein